MGFFRLFLASRRRIYLFILLTFLAGLCAGLGAAQTLSSTDSVALQQLLATFFRSTGTLASPAELFHQNLRVDLLQTLGILYLAGLSLVGVPLILFIVFLRGFILGFAAVLVFTPFSFSRSLLGLAALAPQHVLLVPAFIIAAVACLDFSFAAWRSLFFPRAPWGGRDHGIPRQLLACSVVVLGAGLLVVLADLAGAYLTPALLGLLSTLLS